jgi:hypothetical protein
MLRIQYRVLTVILGSACLFALPALSEPYGNVAAVLELGMGARPLAMGGAFVGLADDANALFFNPAGLAGVQGFSALSSLESRPGIATFGHVSAALPHVGLGIHYFDFGDVPQVDENGNVIGSFSYRNYIFLAGAGVRGSNLPVLSLIPLIRDLGVGVNVKFVQIATLEPGSGSGMAFDLSLLYGGTRTGVRMGLFTGFGLGFTLENAVGVPIKYGSGHQEDWPRSVVVGASVTLLGSWTVVADLAPGKGVRFGVEWCPLPALAVRAGLRSEGVVMWSLGIGVQYGMFTLDYTFVAHPHLAGQQRLSFEVALITHKGGRR